MNQIIRLDTCSTCPLRHQVGAELQCRAEPPNATALLVPGPMGQVQVQVIAAFPVVQPDWWCGSHPSIAAKARAGLLAQPALGTDV